MHEDPAAPGPDDEGTDLSEWVRIAIIGALLVIDASIIWIQVKDRPEVLVWRAKVKEAIAGPIRRRKEHRRAESHVVWEAIEVVEGSKGATNEEAPET